MKRQMNLVPGPRRLDEDEGEDGGELPAREAAAARDLAHGRGGVDVEQHLNQGRIISVSLNHSEVRPSFLPSTTNQMQTRAHQVGLVR